MVQRRLGARDGLLQARQRLLLLAMPLEQRGFRTG
jgi:hypothetical protein